MARPRRPWFRFYVEAMHDRKLRRLPAAQRWVWLAILATARQSPEPGALLVAEGEPATLDDLADTAAVPRSQVGKAVAEYERLGMLSRRDDGSWYVAKWSERQFEGDFSRTTVSDDVRDAVFARDGYECVECGTADNLSIDHIVPVTKGGDERIENLQTMCLSCNARKGNRERQRRYRDRQRDGDSNVTRTRNNGNASRALATETDTDTDTSYDERVALTAMPSKAFDGQPEHPDADDLDQALPTFSKAVAWLADKHGEKQPDDDDLAELCSWVVRETAKRSDREAAKRLVLGGTRQYAEYCLDFKVPEQSVTMIGGYVKQYGAERTFRAVLAAVNAAAGTGERWNGDDAAFGKYVCAVITGERNIA